MRPGSIAFNSPTRLHLGDSVEVTALISPNMTKADLSAALDGIGEKRTGSLQVTPVMEATLTSADEGLKVISTTQSSERAVAAIGLAKWVWLITAMEPGHHLITLDVAAAIPGIESGGRLSGPTFSRAIEVTVSPHERAFNFFSTHWEWLGTTLVIPLLLYFWRKRRGTWRRL